jgi:glycosyltransferase involved in cell wall biosynthesis
LGGRIVRRFERRFARTASLVVVPDGDRAEIIAGQLKLKPFPLIAANAPLRCEIALDNSLRKALANLDRDFERIVFRQGRIGPGHAIEATVKSIPYWNNRNWGFVVMGLSEESYLLRLDSIAREVGVQRQFVVLPPVGYDQVASFTADADVGHALYEPVHVNNVHITTASNKIMEYMSAGVPLVVSKQPSLKNLVNRYGCGVAADEDSPESIATSINTLLSNTHLLKEMGAAGRQAFENVFCYERQFAPVTKRIDSLAGRNGKIAEGSLALS